MPARRFPLDPAFIAKFPRDQRGNVVAEFKRVVLADGPAARIAGGNHRVARLPPGGRKPSRARFVSADVRRVATRPDGNVVGQLRDLGGPFMVSGTVTLSRRRTPISSQGYITGRTANAERLVREITLGAPPDASGRSAFSFEGSLLTDVDFAPRRQQRVVQAGAHRLGSELARQVRVALQLRRVALHFLIEEALADRRPRADWS